MSLSTIRSGLKTNILNALGSSNVNMSGYLLSPIEPPCFEIDFPADGIVYDFTAGRASDELDLIVRGIVSINSPLDAQVLLDTWLEKSGSSSVKAAIESDKTLGGAVDSLRVTQATGHRRAPSPDNPQELLLFAEWSVHIIY